MNISPSTKFTGHAGAIYGLQLDGTFIYSCSADKFVVRWNLETGEQDAFAIKLPSTPYSILLIENATKLVVGLSSGDVHLFDLQARKEEKYYTIHKNGVFSMAQNKENTHVYLADGNGLLTIWNHDLSQLLLQLPFDCGKIRSITPSTDGQHIYLSCQDGFIRVVETKHYNLINEFQAHEGGVGAILETEEALLSGGKDAHLKWWNKSNFALEKSLPAHNFMIYGIEQLTDELIVTASRDKTIKVWNSATQEVIERLDLRKKGHRHSVNFVQKLDATHFATCSDDAQIIVWKIN